MNAPTKKEMRWFVSKLIDIREDTTVTPNHIANVIFSYEEILKQKEKIFTTEVDTEDVVKKKITDMLSLIKEDNEFLSKFNNFNKKLLSWKPSTHDIKIIGYQTGLLKSYLKERVLKGEKVFGLTSNKKGQNVIAVYGDSTGKVIESGEQFLVFCYFLKYPNRLITHQELIGEFKRSLPHDAQHYLLKYPDDQSKEDHIKTVVENLKRKLIEIGKKYDIDIDKVLETISKKGYISHM